MIWIFLIDEHDKIVSLTNDEIIKLLSWFVDEETSETDFYTTTDSVNLDQEMMNFEVSYREARGYSTPISLELPIWSTTTDNRLLW